MRLSKIKKSYLTRQMSNRKLLLKILSLLALGSLLSLVTSCASIPDEPVCFEISPVEGYCVNTISSTEFRVNEAQPYLGQTWWEMRPYMIYLPVSSWVKFKSYIIKRCKQFGCSKEIANWQRTVDTIDAQVKR
jgi:hypothetical protein